MVIGETDMSEEPRLPEIIVGTYEDFVVGYRVATSSTSTRAGSKSSDHDAGGDDAAVGSDNAVTSSTSSRQETKLLQLKQTFADRAHTGSVRSIDASADGRYVASSGIDEMIHVFNMDKRVELGILQTTGDGAINHVRFFDSTHLFAASEDGNIYVFDCKKSMTLVKTLVGHKKGVSHISIHPSGKILLTVSKDCTLRTWNLIKGRCAYITNLRKVGHLLCWSPPGNTFLVAVNNSIDVYEVATGSVVHTINFEKHVNAFEFLSDTTIVVATDSDSVTVYDLDAEKTLNKFKVHDSRVKSLKVLSNVKSPDGKTQTWLVTISSDSKIKLWHLRVGAKSNTVKDLIPLATIDTGVRLTCLTAV